MNALDLHVRPLAPERDLPALLALLNAIREVEGNPPTAAEAVRPSLEAPRYGRWVAEAAGEEGFLGLAVLFQQTPERSYGDIHVHPARRRRGVGRALAGALRTGAAAQGVRYLAIDVEADNQTALRFLLSQGYRFRGDVWALKLPAEAELPAPVWPAGYTVCSYADVDDLPLYTALNNRVFGDLWGHWENTPGLVDEAHVAEILTEFDPRGIFVVFDAGGAAVGECRARAFPPDAHSRAPHILDQPGVAPDHRAAGLHAPLALTAAHWLRAQAARPIRLESWGDAAATIDAYRALGFEPAEHEVSYVLDVAR